MSAPLLSFSDLSLEMPTTRAQSSSSRISMREIQEQSIAEDDESSDEDTADSPTITGPSQLKYDVQRLSPTTKSRVQQAFKRGRFSVDHCRQDNPSQPNGKYAFQIAETTPFSIRIGGPSSMWPTPECFCRNTAELEALSDQEYTQLMEALERVRNSASARQLRSVYEFVHENGMLHVNSSKGCSHMYWLMDQIAGYTLKGQVQDNLYSLSRDGGVIEAGDAFQQISRISLENLAREKNWKLHSNDDHILDTSLLMEDIPDDSRVQETSAAISRKEKTQDMIAALSSPMRPEIFDQLNEPLVEADVLVPHDLEATLARALLVSDACFEFFETAIPLNYRAITAFQRLGEEAKRYLALLDEYMASATRRGSIPTHDVMMTAQSLKGVVASVEREYESRSHAVGPLARSEAAKVLVSILSSVVDRDRDVYSGLRRPRIPIPQDAAERNLYQLLIGSASRREGFFVIGVLDTLPDGAVNLVDELDDIYTQIAAQGAPEGYLSTLRRIIDQARGRDYGGVSPGPSSKRASEAPDTRSGKRQMK